MNILLIATELAPFISPSPVGGSVSSLAKALRLLHHEVTVVLPRLSALDASGLLFARRLTSLPLPSGKAAVHLESQAPSGARILQLDVPGVDLSSLAGGGGLLPEAAAAFAQAVGAYLLAREASGEATDVVHAFGPVSGVVLTGLRARGASARRVLSVHDAEHAAALPLASGELFGFSPDQLTEQGYRAGDELSLLKGAVQGAEVVVVPSPAYARALPHPERLGALSRTFEAARVVGVLEGVDYSQLNPATDASLSARYDAQDPTAKAQNRLAVEQELGLSPDLERPLVLLPTQGLPEATRELLASALPGMVRAGLQVLLLGEAEPTSALARATEHLAGFVVRVPEPGSAGRTRLLAAADFILDLSRQNPGGTHLREGARYGAVPVSLAVDAALDVIVDVDPELRTGTGLLFEPLSTRSLHALSGRIVAVYRSRSFPQLLRRVLRQDLAWDGAVRRLVSLYRAAGAAS